LESGDLRLFVERGGRSLLTHGTVGAANVGALATIAARSKKFEVTTVDGEPVAHSQIERLLRDAGFAPTPRGLVLVTARQGWSRS